jgi:Ca-activated chloride channel homolog
MKINASLILANQARPVHFALHFESPNFTPTRPRPAAFCLVLDRSGSMHGQPLEKAKQAAKLAVRNLRPADNFSLVIFDTEAQVLVPSQSATNKESFVRAIETIQAGDSTNLMSLPEDRQLSQRRELSKHHEGPHRSCGHVQT